MPVKKIHFTFILIIIVAPVFSQVNTYSPYSRFGLGELTMPGFGQNRAMGSSGIALRSPNQINYLNPASYTAIDTMSFIFDFGLNASSTDYSSQDLNSNLKNMNIDHLAIAFAINKWWKASAGVSPYSSTGYNIIQQINNPDFGLVDYYFEGTGGLNRLYFGTSVKLYDRFSVGVNMSNFFGFIQNTQGVKFLSDPDASESFVNDRMVIRGILLNFGVQYHQVFNDKYFLTAGAIYDNQTNFNSRQKLLYQNYFPGSASLINDSTVVNPQFELEKTEKEGNIIYPRKFGAGIAFGLKDKLILTGDYQTQQWSKTQIMDRNDSLINSNSMNFGLELTPNPDALRGYLNRVHYRLGGYYSNTYLRIRGEQIKDYGITFGVGLPFKGSKTTFNLGMVLGQRGTLENSLIKENYGIIHLSFTLHDFWFFKRKFD